MVARAGEAASFPFLVHSHMLRHSCGCKLANDGQDTRAIQHYLGHKSINSTMSDLRLEAWRERCGISVPEGEMLQAWRKLQDLAVMTIKIVELEVSGIRDGDGSWHGGDVIGGLLRDLEANTARLKQLTGLPT